ncbi:hypothetical protein, partial [Xylella fastidiosa]|uniref:hypothetical protein n=1 Tax=Xylella fastidiosa TaxID=2371 RepID=UPI001BD25E56
PVSCGNLDREIFLNQQLIWCFAMIVVHSLLCQLIRKIKEKPRDFYADAAVPKWSRSGLLG